VPAPAPAPAAAASPQPPKEICILSHSGLYYWWPVWVIGFILGGLSFFDGNSMYILPAGTTPHHVLSGSITEEVAKDKKTTTELTNRGILVLPEKYSPVVVPPQDKSNPYSPPDPIKLHVAHRGSYGPIFATVLVLVIVITNVPLRGMWSLLVIVTIAMLIVILSLIEGAWESIFRWASFMDIRINAGGYFFISTVLCIIWCITVFLFDRAMYMEFSAGQLKVCTEIGGGQKVYDTGGMAFEKEKSDLFRHYVLGLGSGDLIIKIAGTHSEHLRMPNVLWIGSRVEKIERLIKQRAVVARS